jgi:hypothetical protein
MAAEGCPAGSSRGKLLLWSAAEVEKRWLAAAAAAAARAAEARPQGEAKTDVEGEGENAEVIYV